MAYGRRYSPSSSPQFSAKSSATRSKHHRKTPHKHYHYSDEDDYVDSASDMSNGDDEDHEINDYDDVDASDFHSESMTNPRSNDPKTLLRSNGLSAAASSSSVSTTSNLIDATCSYINIAPLPIFHGNPNECPVTHLSRFAKVCRANNVSSVEMMMRIFAVTLEDEAGLWYDLNIEPYPSLTWEDIKSSFLHAYNKTQVTEQLRNELMMINQGSEEGVRSYFLRLQWSLQKWPDHGIPEGLLKEIFVDGLREDYREWITPQKPDSLAEALRLAFAFEQVKDIKLLRKKELKCDFCEGAHEERSCQVRERMKELWRKMKDKDKQWIDSSENYNQCNNKGVNQEENVVEQGDENGNKKKKSQGQCQCWKHQCWKKKLERTNSLVSRHSNAESLPK